MRTTSRSVPREEEISSDSQTHTSPPQSCPHQQRWRKGRRNRSLRMHTILHPNFACPRQCVLAPTVANKNPEPDPPPHRQPLPLRLPPGGPPPPHYSIALGAKTDASQGLLQSASPRLSRLLQPRPGSAASGRAPAPAPDSPLSLLHPPLPRHTLGSGPRGGRAGTVGTGGAPAEAAGIAGFSLHIGVASAVGTVGGGRLPVAPRPGTAPHTGRGEGSWTRGQALKPGS